MTKHLTIDELLAKATEEPKKRVRIENNTNTLRYIQEMGFEPGTEAVPNYVLFYHYRIVWGIGSDARHYKANKIVFFRTFSQKFPNYRTGRQRYYLLKEGTINITPELLEGAKDYAKRFHKKKPSIKREETVRPVEQEGSQED